IPGLPWVAAFDCQGLAGQARSLEPILCPPLVLTKDETHRVLQHLEGLPLLMARLLYGTGIRLHQTSHPRQHYPDLPPRP
ncbi:MAG: hypothetical protein NTW21_19575, partial [Verrucomicrobia bacterium]|nr:hypothetical protein [Verrucomicrobiota bacterium]